MDLIVSVPEFSYLLSILIGVDSHLNIFVRTKKALKLSLGIEHSIYLPPLFYC